MVCNRFVGGYVLVYCSAASPEICASTVGRRDGNLKNTGSFSIGGLKMQLSCEASRRITCHTIPLITYKNIIALIY